MSKFGSFGNPRNTGSKSRVEAAMEENAKRLREQLDEEFIAAAMGGRRSYTGHTQTNSKPEAASAITMRTVRDAVDRMNGVYRPSPIADEAEKGLVIEGTSRRN